MKRKIALGVFIVGVLGAFYTLVQNEYLPKQNQEHETETTQNSEVTREASSSTTTLKNRQKREDIKAIIVAIEKLQNCEQDNSCPEDISDPRASEFLRAQMMVTQIEKLSSFSNHAVALDKARELLSFPSGHVGESALKLLLASEPNTLNIEPTLTMLSRSFDAKNSALILQELI